MASEIDLTKYTVIKDSREQEGFLFDNMIIQKLDSGDYSLKGFESILAIERKKSTGELAMNLFESRFEKELVRLDSYKYPFLICEFDFESIILFPEGSGIPKNVWPKLKVNSGLILKKLTEWGCKYRTKMCFAGKYGKAMCESIFKRVLELEHAP